MFVLVGKRKVHEAFYSLARSNSIERAPEVVRTLYLLALPQCIFIVLLVG